MATDVHEQMNGVIPYLAIPNAAEAMAFYARAFGAEEIEPAARDEKGRIMNASLLINGGTLMIMDVMEEHGIQAAKTSRGFNLQLIVSDGDHWWNRAVEAGCEVTQPLEKQFWGDRYGQLRDPFGLDWAINERVRTTG